MITTFTTEVSGEPGPGHYGSAAFSPGRCSWERRPTEVRRWGTSTTHQAAERTVTIDRAQAQLTEAREAGAAAALRGADASAEVLISGLTGSPNAGAMADLDAARTDADAAAKREGAAKRELEGAEEDLRAAQKRGERAERATERRELLGGRKAWWREDSGTVVIRDPGSPDGGTAFRPRDGYNYFRGLR